MTTHNCERKNISFDRNSITIRMTKITVTNRFQDQATWASGGGGFCHPHGRLRPAENNMFLDDSFKKKCFFFVVFRQKVCFCHRTLMPDNARQGFSNLFAHDPNNCFLKFCDPL